LKGFVVEMVGPHLWCTRWL